MFSHGLKLESFTLGKLGRQTLLLYFSQVLVTALGIITITLNTNILGPVGYGKLAFIVTITEFSLFFFRFGFFSSGAVLLAEEQDETATRGLIGALVLIGLVIGILFAVFIFSSSFFLDQIFRADSKHLFRIASPLFIFLPFQLLIPQMSSGSNRIGILSSYLLISKFLYITFLGLLALLRPSYLSVDVLVVANYMCQGIATLIALKAFKPTLTSLRINLKRIWERNKTYGFHLYLGQISDKASYKTDGILISYYVNTVQLGFYNLATFLMNPALLLSQSLTTAMFKQMASRTEINKRIIWINAAWLIACTAGISLLGGTIVRIFFGNRYAGMNPLILPLALTGLFQGLYQPYNMFLAAKSKGRWLKRISITQAAFNVPANLFFIYYWGAWGAASASLIAAIIAYLGHMHFYRRFMLGQKIYASVSDIGI